ncbi:MAG TPA: alkaline phosphatase family protein, partial [Candidatus Acidoferrales bacterium]|nr:alkaline phosphatase family protein [Candidatus Acidoferrales bacterium]
MRVLCAFFAAALILSGCARSTSSPALPAAGDTREVPAVKDAPKITHVVFIVQENRTFDSIFGGPNPFPGADAATSGKMSNGSTTPLTSVTIENPIGNGDPNNYHFQWLKACNAPTAPPFKVGQPSPCRMNGFDQNAKQQAGYPGPPGDTYKGSLQYIYSYVDRKESAPYWFIAKHYAVGDRFFMGHNSESFTAHQYIFSSQSRNMVDSPVFPKSTSCSIYYDYCAYTPWGCDSPVGTKTYFLSSADGSWNGGPPTAPDGPAPCFGNTNPYLSVAQLAQKKNVSWRLYAYSMCSGIVGLDVNYALRNSNLWPNPQKMKLCHSNYGLETPLEAGSAHFRAPQYDFLVDEVPPGQGGRPLTNITWILPGAYTSDHPGVPGG